MDAQNGNSEFKFHSIGEQLKAARLSQSLTLEDIADKTRVPIRHLQAIEDSEFSKLPGRTYTLGFAKAYASAVGLPAAKISQELALELDDAGEQQTGHSAPMPYDVSDLEKIPSRKLMWISLVAGLVIILAGYGIWRSFFFPATDTGLQADVAAAPAPDKTNAPPTGALSQLPSTSGEVVFTAQEDIVWVKFYDGSGKQLMQKEMALGEQYAVPADADNPQIWTGRPNALAITIDGKTVPPISTEERTVKDVPVSAKALLARVPVVANVAGDVEAGR